MIVPPLSTENRVAAIRSFNRFYSRKFGILGERLMGSPFSLTEVRVLYELAHRETVTAGEICESLGLDPGYMSRMLRAFGRQGLIAKQRSSEDGRRAFLELTPKGRGKFRPLDKASRTQVRGFLKDLSEDERGRLIGAMRAIQELLEGRPDAQGNIVLREPRPGDLGWIVHRHGYLYAKEHGWNQHFEGLVAEIIGKFARHFDSKRERCWVAERDGRILGSAFVAQQSDRVARFRLLLVEPEARGAGLGTRLVQECVQFARAKGYKKAVFWTNDAMRAARRIYRRAGFRLVARKPHRLFGPRAVGEDWEMTLQP